MTANTGLRYGPMLVGIYLNCILYGVTLVQILVYFQTFKSDKWWMKLFVLYLLICETLNTVFDAGVAFEPLILRYGTPQVATHAPIMLSTNPLTTVMVSLPVQLFIAWRVKIMSRSNIVPAVICFFALASFVGGVMTTVGVIIIKFEYSKFAVYNGTAITWLASAAIADVIITTSLVLSLIRKRTGFPASDDVINKIIRLTLQTGFITALSATLDLTLFLIYNTSGFPWNFIWDFMLSKLYSNTILSSLNARGGWKATSTLRDNILFGNGTGRESIARTRTQVEIMTVVTTDFGPQTCTIPMKVLDSGDISGHHSAGRHSTDSVSAANVAPAYTEAI